MEDLNDIARAYGFELKLTQSGHKGAIGKNAPWTCVLVEGEGDNWILHDNAGHRFGGRSPLEFAAVLYHQKIKVVDQVLLMEIAQRNGWAL